MIDGNSVFLPGFPCRNPASLATRTESSVRQAWADSCFLKIHGNVCMVLWSSQVLQSRLPTAVAVTETGDEDPSFTICLCLSRASSSRSGAMDASGASSTVISTPPDWLHLSRELILPWQAGWSLLAKKPRFQLIRSSVFSGHQQMDGGFSGSSICTCPPPPPKWIFIVEKQSASWEE